MDKLKNIIKSDTPTEESTGGAGSAAVGETSTYSSSHLGRGDPTSSVVDPESNDPLTYKKPESSSVGSSGVPAGSAATAASIAGSENPYRASSLDPRVDGGKKSDPPIMSGTSQTSSAGRDMALAGATQAFGTSHHSESAATAPAPSSLTSTVNPTDRSAEYSQSTATKGLDHATPSATSSFHPTATGTTSTTDDTSMVTKALGAVGLGGLAGTLGYGASHHENTSAVSEPTTTTGVDTYTAPTRSGPPAHYRRESIPTTAYPAGIDSPRAINPPVGGTRASIDQGSQQTSHGAGVGPVAAAGAAALGAGAVGHHEYEKSQALRESVTGEAPSAVSTGSHQGGSSAVPGEMYDESKALRGNVLSDSTPSSGPTVVHNTITVGDEAPITSSGLRDSSVIGHGIMDPKDSASIPAYSSTQESGKFTSTPLKDESHTGRNVALGGAAATAVGAGAYAAHEHGQEVTTSAPYGSTQESGKFTSTPLKDQSYTSHGTAAGEAAVPTVPSGTTQQTGKFTSTPMESGKFTSAPLKDESHTGRDAAIGGAAVAAAGAGAYGAHEHSAKEAAKEQAAHQKELEKSEKAHQKELEKEHTREEKAHAKEVAALEKKHEKEEAKHAKELEKKQEKEEAKLAKEAEKEKKPSIFKRIFKRRKNKDTGADEDYSTDEEDSSHKGAVAGAGVAGATGAAVAHEHGTADTSATSEGFTKPSYNPFAHDDPAHTTSTAERPTESITGLPYDPSKDPKTAESLSGHQHGTGMASAVGPTDTNDLAEERMIGTGEHKIDPIAAGSFQMGEIVDKHGHGSTSHAGGTDTT